MKLISSKLTYQFFKPFTSGVEGYFNFVHNENICNRLWQTAQNIYIHDQYTQPSWYCYISWRLGLGLTIVELLSMPDLFLMIVSEQKS